MISRFDDLEQLKDYMTIKTPSFSIVPWKNKIFTFEWNKTVHPIYNTLKAYDSLSRY